MGVFWGELTPMDSISNSRVLSTNSDGSRGERGTCFTLAQPEIFLGGGKAGDMA